MILYLYLIVLLIIYIILISHFIKGKKYTLSVKNNRYKLPDHMIGQHNYLNATAAIAVGCQLNINVNKQINSLETFRGVQKRMEYIGQVNGTKIYDDFAHHPTAIKLSIEGIMSKHKNQKLLTWNICFLGIQVHFF